MRGFSIGRPPVSGCIRSLGLRWMSGVAHSYARLIGPRAMGRSLPLPIQIQTGTMRQIQLLKQLIHDSQYAIDEALVANAIIARAATRCLVPGTAFRNDVRAPQVQSFRPSRHARSFRPCNAAQSGEGRGLIAQWRRM